MQEGLKVLYITFVDFDVPSGSGSSVRPKRMYDAFKDFGCEVMLVSGIGNSRKKRVAAVACARKWLKNNTPDLCYIEPPSGPLFFSCDRQLIKKVHKMQIPIGIFYRDIYWKFSSSDFKDGTISLSLLLKSLLIKAMQYRDLLLIKKYTTRIYLPSTSVNEYTKLREFGVLPPGCQKKTLCKNEHKKIAGIYVGGATERYGMRLLLESWMKATLGQEAELIVVCPEVQWNVWVKEHPKYHNLPNNIKIYHLCDGEELEKLYEISDFALIPILKTKYNDMSMPIKLYEYISNGLPIVSTNCEEMQNVIKQYDLGILSDDNVDDFSKGIDEMIGNMRTGMDYTSRLEIACKHNLWTERVKTVICDLLEVQ